MVPLRLSAGKKELINLLSSKERMVVAKVYQRIVVKDVVGQSVDNSNGLLRHKAK